MSNKCNFPCMKQLTEYIRDNNTEKYNKLEKEIMKKYNVKSVYDFNKTLKKIGKKINPHVKYSNIRSRRFMEQYIPCLKGPMLFVGWKKYNAFYKQICPMVSLEYMPMEDYPPNIVADMTNDNLNIKKKFNTVILNGIIGFGVNSDSKVDKCLQNCRNLLNKDGVLFLGWNIRENLDTKLYPTKKIMKFLEPYFKKIDLIYNIDEDVKSHRYITAVRRETIKR